MGEVHVVARERAGLELDEYLCLLYPGWSKGFLRRQVRQGAVLVDGAAVQPSVRLRPDQVLLVEIDADDAPVVPVAPAEEIRVLHEAPGWMVVDKPAGIAVEPERWHRGAASVSGGLLAVAGAPEAGGPAPERLRLVHRLDKETSGALIVARDLEAERALRRAFEEGRVEKRYLALIEGEFPLEDGEEREIDHPIGPDGRRSGRMVVCDEKAGRGRRGAAGPGKPSRTVVRVAQRFRGFTLLECEPRTGRTHQIRVHLAHEGFPLAVDKLYGRRDELLLSSIKPGYRPKPGRPERPLIDRLTLHATCVGVPDPSTAAPVRVEAPVPKDFERVLTQLKKHRGVNR